MQVGEARENDACAKNLEALQEGMAYVDIQRVCWSLGCYSEDKGKKEERKGRGVVH